MKFSKFFKEICYLSQSHGCDDCDGCDGEGDSQCVAECSCSPWPGLVITCHVLAVRLSISHWTRERERESATVRFVTREAETLECPSLSHLERYSLSSRLNMLDTCYMLSMLI